MKSPIERPPIKKYPISIRKIIVITSLDAVVLPRIMMLSHQSTKTNTDKYPCKNKSRKLPY